MKLEINSDAHREFFKLKNLYCGVNTSQNEMF